MLVGYARTSTADQEAGFEAQLRDLGNAGVEKIYSEKVSSIGQRDELTNALDYVRDGDTLVITKLDRLARSTADLLKVIDHLDQKKVGLRILDFGGSAVDTKSPTGKLMLTMFAAMAQFEREIMLERQREGIAKAKAEGKYKGRKPTVRNRANEIRELKEKGMAATEIAKELNVGRASVYRALAS
ncbi:recombinase family protein [Roseibium alexandrii]